jgi:Uma2 family endonuclease
VDGLYAELRNSKMTAVCERDTDRFEDTRVLRLAERPITFDRFVEITGEDDDLELVRGALVEKMAAQYPHERRFAWLFTILNMYVRTRNLGVVLGSRSAVKIDEFGGRLPDLLFIRRDREHIIQNKGIIGAPDLVVEIVSPNDSSADLINLEAEYRSIGVREIVFWDAGKKRVTVLRKRNGNYAVETLTQGTFQSETVDGFRLDVSDMLADPLPDETEILAALLAESPAA